LFKTPKVLESFIPKNLLFTFEAWDLDENGDVCSTINVDSTCSGVKEKKVSLEKLDKPIYNNIQTSYFNNLASSDIPSKYFGTLNGAQFNTNGHIGDGAYEFDGQYDYIILDGNFDEIVQSQEATFAVWVNVTKQNIFQVIFQRGLGFGGNDGLRLQMYPGDIVGFTNENNDGTKRTVFSNGPVSTVPHGEESLGLYPVQ